MSKSKMITLGDAIFGKIDDNDFLNELYDNILYNYALKKLNLVGKRQMRDIDVTAALRFSDLLSKSTNQENSDKHKMWAQEIVSLLDSIYEDNAEIRLYAGSVFSNTGNHRGVELVQSNYVATAAMEKIFSAFSTDYLTIPAAPDKRFLRAQKNIYDHLTDDYFSYSGPTSMGKSFIMQMFIKDQIIHGAEKNYALVVPTKALINEIRSQAINELMGLLALYNYRVVTAAGDLALEGEHNFILVLTPERLLYLMISKPELRIDYLFIDEAHKLSGKNSRSPFYYKVVDMLASRESKPHVIFASPNIPNPEVYLKLLPDADISADCKVASSYSPVSQVKFLMDLNDHSFSIYNEHTQELETVSTIKKEDAKLLDFLILFDRQDNPSKMEEKQRTIIYCSGKADAVSLAREFADQRQNYHDDELSALAKDIRNEVHGDYYLADILEKGVAYHIGYLPSAIRMRIEDLFRKGKINTMFCTSTLVEGVNLPADNLFITNFRNGRAKMTAVDFRNLIGRVGRIKYNLYGNVFLVCAGERIKQEDYIKLLKQEVPEQKLSLESDLKPKAKNHVIQQLIAGNVDFGKLKNQTEEESIMMRKFGLILLHDIVNDRNSLVRREFASFMADGDEGKIKAAFADTIAVPDDDINVSVDQAKHLTAAIYSGLAYPQKSGDGFDYDDVVAFLEKLCRIFKWDKYEMSTLGKTNELGQHPLLRWYAVILIQWMEGTGLSNIMKKAIEYRQEHPDNFWINNHEKTYYNDTREHRNIVIADTLEVIENIILFSISNYFLRFSNEYKRIHEVHEFDNNWYENVEYGTTNPITIQLQRNGFSREASTYIRTHRSDYVVEDTNQQIKLRRSLLQCSNSSVKKEAEDIQYNVPGIFVD
ncbi:helicase [Dehalococcoides mccartyi]|uniref:DEAD/DEAH box helicase n=1 Tax=Dehalococcoides mccartyi TaxID=61435 RepID=UPI000994DD54|nr:DEAD/DEAH box helicase [Dehalococcoides mccartyi]AQW61915.1 helicase [Dehalococcoides mccartyi]